jgi:putative transposon-encoded protein
MYFELDLCSAFLIDLRHPTKHAIYRFGDGWCVVLCIAQCPHCVGWFQSGELFITFKRLLFKKSAIFAPTDAEAEIAMKKAVRYFKSSNMVDVIFMKKFGSDSVIVEDLEQLNEEDSSVQNHWGYTAEGYSNSVAVSAQMGGGDMSIPELVTDCNTSPLTLIHITSRS